MLASEFPEASIAQSFEQIPGIDCGSRVSLARECEHCIRPTLDAAMRGNRQVNSKKRKGRIGNRVDEPPHQVSRCWLEFEVLASEWDDLNTWIQSGLSCDSIGMQSRTSDCEFPCTRTVSRVDHTLRVGGLDARYGAIRHDRRSKSAKQHHESIHHHPVIRHSGIWHMQGSHTPALGFDLSHTPLVDDSASHSVRTRASVQCTEPEEFALMGRHHKFPAAKMRQSLLREELFHEQFSASAEFCPKGSGSVVHARMNHIGIASRLVRAHCGFLLQNR